MAQNKRRRRAVVEVSFIIFLFYANLLMGEFNGSGQGQKYGLLWALKDIFTLYNFAIAITAAVAGHLVFDYLRRTIL